MAIPASISNWSSPSAFTIAMHRRIGPEELDGLPPAEMISTISLADAAGTTTVTAHIDCLSIAHRDETVKRGFTGMVSIGNDRLADYLATLKSEGGL